MKVVDGGRTYDVRDYWEPEYELRVQAGGQCAVSTDGKGLRADIPNAELDSLRHLSGGAWQLLRPKKGRANPFVDPAAYKSYVADWEKAFRAELWRAGEAIIANLRVNLLANCSRMLL
jgi:hypothetical protein